MESELIRQAKAGDQDAFTALHNTCCDDVFRFLRLMVGDDYANEAYADTFSRAWRSIGTISGNSFKQWVLGIARNVSNDRFRDPKRKRFKSLDNLQEERGFDPPSEASWGHPERTALLNEALREVGAALLQLNPKLRLVVILKGVLGLDYTEIARIIEQKEVTARTRFHKARIELLRILGPEWNISMPPTD